MCAASGYLPGVDREHWQALAARHTAGEQDRRRCRECGAYWPCLYRLRADVELSPPSPS